MLFFFLRITWLGASVWGFIAPASCTGSWFDGFGEAAFGLQTDGAPTVCTGHRTRPHSFFSRLVIIAAATIIISTIGIITALSCKHAGCVRQRSGASFVEHRPFAPALAYQALPGAKAWGFFIMKHRLAAPAARHISKFSYIHTYIHTRSSVPPS